MEMIRSNRIILSLHDKSNMLYHKTSTGTDALLNVTFK
jgi:hypothetical protein